jgi:hypothetical protein
MGNSSNSTPYIPNKSQGQSIPMIDPSFWSGNPSTSGKGYNIPSTSWAGSANSTNNQQYTPNQTAATLPPPQSAGTKATVTQVIPQGNGVPQTGSGKGSQSNVQSRANGGHVGALRGATGGRADELPMSVPNDSHVIPADVVSALGDGNTEAGFKVLENMFPESSRPSKAFGGGMGHSMGMKSPKMGGMHAPGAKMPHIPGMHMPGMHMASGGDVGCKLSDGEFVVGPRGVIKAGNGNSERGHRALDSFILHTRAEDIRRRQHLPPPVQS